MKVSCVYRLYKRLLTQSFLWQRVVELVAGTKGPKCLLLIKSPRESIWRSSRQRLYFRTLSSLVNAECDEAMTASLRPLECTDWFLSSLLYQEDFSLFVPLQDLEESCF